ncbi:hypothetical protein AGABI1DRAFT_76799 [Agaricus bisporus var. burnettii JB137-S8]|uniref:Uncharacterized protein n=1 Tax=Agaricus bisporus var. burnettii (strain JB137-S8 / ATCC MYA-4627 / FGSC 10392) TaxID=597362 RepID=K5VTJ8_AGABU|nr:uncharacterized protein AGABI1DRAFT_76799 [Agaricus bisporus var. burnettii JB137-S8]EKM77794.1 hypothetical protein AGABI1DRAFT_76799 [Agaricus bisporus var. burnettii JB137-S8]
MLPQSFIFSCFLPFVLFRPLAFGVPALSYNSEQITTLTYNFTLSAYNISRPNDNKIGAPLVLGQNGATSGVTPHVTSTHASFPYDDYPILALIDGSLRAYRSDGSWNTNATEVHGGTTLSWITTTIPYYSRPAPEIYSIVNVPLTKYPLLAAHGRHDLWSLCPFPGRLGQTNVVYNVSVVMNSTRNGFDTKECYEVILFTVPSLTGY